MRIITLFFSFTLLSIVFLADFGYMDAVFAYFKSIFSYADKVGHFILFGSLTFLINLMLKARKIEVFSLSIFVGTILMTTIMTLEEFSQIFIPARQFEWLDLLSNYAGILTFSYIVPYFKNRK